MRTPAFKVVSINELNNLQFPEKSTLEQQGDGNCVPPHQIFATVVLIDLRTYLKMVRMICVFNFIY